MNTSTNQTSLTRPHARPRSRKAAPTTGRGWWRGLLLATVVLLAASCTEEEPGIVTTLKDTYQVRLMVNPQQAATRAPGDDENALRQLRVYVFNTQGNRVGYYENMNLTATGAYYVPFRLQEGGQLTFYVVANENGAGSTTGLSENTPLNDLRTRAGFLTDNIDRDPGDLLTGEATATITATPEGTAPQSVTVKLVRPFSLLQVFFAKSTEDVEATVNNVSLTNYSRYGYFHDRDLADYGTRNGNIVTTAALLLGTTQTVAQVVSEEQQLTGDYGEVVASKPVTLKPEGNSQWGTTWTNADPSGSATENVACLTVAYTMGSEQRTGNIYLPAISKTNVKYNVKCLLLESGGLTVNCAVQPWDDKESEYVVSDDGTFELGPVNMVSLTPGGKDYATQYMTGADAQSRQFTFTVTMTAPEGVRWQAHLTNPLDFEFVEDDNHASEGVGGTEAQPTTIQVRPTRPYDVASGARPETDLYITIGTAPENQQMFDPQMVYGTTGTQIHIVQVSPVEGDQLVWPSTQQP